MRKKIAMSRSYLLIIIVLILSNVKFVSCECTREYIFDMQAGKNENKKPGFDSAYFFTAKIEYSDFKKINPVLKIHGTDYANMQLHNGIIRSISLQNCLLFWNQQQDSLHFIKSEDNYFFFSDNNNNRHKGSDKFLNLVIRVQQDSAGANVLTEKKYILKKHSSCRVGLH